jgi:hypothetical protein
MVGSCFYLKPHLRGTKGECMKKLMIMALAIGFSGAYAHADAACKQVRNSAISACEAGGFQPKEHKKTGKGLWKDCMEKLKNGENVSGVNFNAADLKACHDKAQAKKAAKAASPTKS